MCGQSTVHEKKLNARDKAAHICHGESMKERQFTRSARKLFRARTFVSGSNIFGLLEVCTGFAEMDWCIWGSVEGAALV